MIKALVTIGRYKDEEVEISQWSNDWFSTVDGRMFTVNMLSFSIDDIDTIKNNGRNTGYMFEAFEFVVKNNRAVLRKKKHKLQ